MRRHILILIITLLSPAISQADSLRVGFLGLTYHGKLPLKGLTKSMPRKLDKNATFVWHPELNISYVKDNGLILNATIVRDCLDNEAHYFGLGKRYHINDDLYASWIVGLYDVYSPTLWSKRGILYEREIIPMPQIVMTKSFDFYGKKLSLEVSSSIILTHTTLGVEF